MGFLEAAAHPRSGPVQTLAAGSLLIWVTGAAWLLLGQAVFSQQVLLGSDQASALDTSVLVMTSVDWRDVVAFLLPLSFPFCLACWLELRGVRRRWQPILISPISVPSAAVLLGMLHAGPADANALDLVIVSSCTFLIPLTNALAAIAQRLLDARRSD